MGALSLFLVIAGGTAYAANTVGSSDIIDETILSVDVKNDEIRRADVRNDTLAGGGLVPADLATDSVRTAEIQNSQVISEDVRNDSSPGGGLTAIDLATGAVGSAEIGDGEVKSAEIGSQTVTQDDLHPAQRVNLVGDIDGPAFLPANDSTTWQNLGSFDSRVGFWRDPYGLVHLQGTLCAWTGDETCRTGNILADDSVFDLPAGFRPADNSHFATVSGDAGGIHGSVLVTDYGTVFARRGGYQEFSLDGITFRCAPAGADGCPLPPPE
jgi:hypothetical protein